MVRNWFCGFLFVAACLPVARAQTTFTLQIAVDNDYAVFTGTSSSVTRLLYQNNTDWTSQIGAVASLNFSLEAGETTFYILAMDDAGDANISGQVNGVNLVDLFNGNNASVRESSDISSYLTRYSISGTAIENGSYTVSLSQVQAAFSGVTWGTPSIVQVSASAPAVVAGNSYAYSSAYSNNVGFYSIQGGAALFSFGAQDVGVAVTAVPEPATDAVLAGLAVFGLVCWRRRRVRPAVA